SSDELMVLLVFGTFGRAVLVEVRVGAQLGTGLGLAEHVGSVLDVLGVLVSVLVSEADGGQATLVLAGFERSLVGRQFDRGLVVGRNLGCGLRLARGVLGDLLGAT